MKKEKCSAFFLIVIMTLFLCACGLSSKNEINKKVKNDNSGITKSHKTKEETTESIEEKEEVLIEYSVGDTISFGRYEQDNNTDNGTEEIDWVVLDKKEGKLFLISKFILDSKPYCENRSDRKNLTWEVSPLRNWLNTDFYQCAFSEEEKDKILETSVTTPDIKSSLGRVFDGGNDTIDKVFLLSVEEVEYYLDIFSDRYVPADFTEPTLYAEVNGVEKVGERDQFGYTWWLRTHGEGPRLQSRAGYNNNNKCIFTGSADNDFICGIRPAMWIEYVESDDGNHDISNKNVNEENKSTNVTKNYREHDDVFVVKVKGKSVDLTTDFIQIINDMVDEDVYVWDMPIMNSLSRDGLYDRRVIPAGDRKGIVFVYVKDEVRGELAEFTYEFTNDDKVNYSELVDTLQVVNENDDLKGYVRINDYVEGLYVDGKIVSVDEYKEKYETLKKENLTISEIDSKYGADFSTYLGRLAYEYREISGYTITAAENVYPNIKEHIYLILAYMEARNRLIEQEISWCGLITIDDSYVRYKYVTANEDKRQEIIDRDMNRLSSEYNYGYVE